MAHARGKDRNRSAGRDAGIGRAGGTPSRREGAKVIVNDVGASRGRRGHDVHPADRPVQDIKDAGGDPCSTAAT